MAYSSGTKILHRISLKPQKCFNLFKSKLKMTLIAEAITYVACVQTLLLWRSITYFELISSSCKAIFWACLIVICKGSASAPRGGLGWTSHFYSNRYSFLSKNDIKIVRYRVLAGFIRHLRFVNLPIKIS